ASQPQATTTLGADRDGQGHGTVRGLDPQLRAEDRLPRPERQLHLGIVAVHAVTRMCDLAEMQVQIARGRALPPWLALTRQPEDRPAPRPEWDIDLETLSAGKLDAPPAASEHLVEPDGKLGLDVHPRHDDANATAPSPSPCPPEQRGEEI